MSGFRDNMQFLNLSYFIDFSTILMTDGVLDGILYQY